MSKPKILKLFDENVEGSIYSKLNNPVTVTLTNRSLVVSGVVDVQDNSILTFKPGCSCTEVDSITINSKVYTIKDSSGNIVTGNSDTWSDGAVISVALDTADREAYILSSNFKTIGDHVSNNNNPHNVTAGQLGALEKSGGTMTGDINMGNKSITSLKDPVNDYDATTKKYVDDLASKSDPYKLGDILTTVRTDLDESWALCNGDYVDESQPIYNILPNIPYADATIYKTYNTLTYEYKSASTTCNIKLSNIIQYIDGYYVLYGSHKSSSSTYYATVITTDLLGNNLKNMPDLYLNAAPDNDLLVKYNGYYLTLRGNSIYSINFSTGSSKVYLSGLDKSYANDNMKVYNENLILLSPDKSKFSDEFKYTLDSTNNILYTNTISYVVNNKVYAIKCKNYAGLIVLDLYTYEDTSKTFKLLSNSITTNVPVSITGAPINALSSIYLYYVDETYYLIASRSLSNKSFISLIKSKDGKQWIYTNTIEYSGGVVVSGILSNYLAVSSTTNNIFSSNTSTRLIQLSNFVDSMYVDTPYAISRLVYNDNHEALFTDTENDQYVTVLCQGKMLPILTNSIAYNYIKIGGNS